MDLQNRETGNLHRVGSMASDLSATAAEQADKAIAATKRVADTAAQSVNAGLDALQQKVPGMLTHAGATADELIAIGMQRARDASTVVRDTTDRAQERAVVYIRDEPLKAVLIAAGIGALAALILSSRSSR